MTPRRSHLAFLLVCLYALVCHAQYHVIPGDTDEYGCSGKKPAQICIGSSGTEHCYEPQREELYTFGLEPEAIPAGQINEQPLILFSATFSGCGSGTLTDYSLLTIKNGDLVKLSPKIQLTNQSEYQLWHLNEISQLPVLVTADFIWDFKTETHFSRHRYMIRAYTFDPHTDKYIEKISFSTTKKYPGLDEAEQISILNSEKAAIENHLRQSAR